MKRIGPPSTCPLAALYFYEAGFDVIPVVPGTKRTAEKWTPWAERRSEKAIAEHYRRHPDHEVGCMRVPAEETERWSVCQGSEGREPERAMIRSK